MLPTYQPTYQPTDTPSYRDARTHLRWALPTQIWPLRGVTSVFRRRPQCPLSLIIYPVSPQISFAGLKSVFWDLKQAC